MGSDSISSNTRLPSFSRKKKTNRLAKIKQSKLDVRREQWLSQVKNKGCKVDSNGRGESFPPSMKMGSEANKSLASLEVISRKEEIEELSIHESDLESLVSSSSGSSLGLNDSRKSHGGSSSSSSSSSSSFCSGSVSEEEEDDGNLENWEAIADALNANDNQHKTILNSPATYDTRNGSADPQSNNDPGVNLPISESRGMLIDSHTSCRAWMPDDAFRPQSLPSLSKQNSDEHCGHGAINCAWQSRMSPPSPCPICFEDLDATDTSFLPCSCGFRLCLFCHKRILEEDGRCPGCRKQYVP